MSAMLEHLKAKQGPGGDLYLTPNEARAMLRWLELTEKMWAEQDDLVAHLQELVKGIPVLKIPREEP